MTVDYDTPKYPISDAAKAIGIPLNTLRAYFQRGHFRVIGKPAETPGLPHTINLYGILGMAVAKSLIDAGIHPKIAFDASMMHFAHASHGERLPGRMHPTLSFTVLLFYPQNNYAKVIAFDEHLDFSDIFDFDGERANPVVVWLNRVEREVFDKLNIHSRIDATA